MGLTQKSINELVGSENTYMLFGAVDCCDVQCNFLSFERIYDKQIFDAFESYYVRMRDSNSNYERHLINNGLSSQRIYCLSVKVYSLSCRIETPSDSDFTIVNEFGQSFEGLQLGQCYARKGHRFFVNIPPNYNGVLKFYYILPDDDVDYKFVMENRYISWKKVDLCIKSILDGCLDKSNSLLSAIEGNRRYGYVDCDGNTTTLNIVNFRPSTDKEKKLMHRDKYGFAYINDKDILDNVSLYTMEIVARSHNRGEYAIMRCPFVIYDDSYYVYRGYNIYLYEQQDTSLETYVFALPKKQSNYYILCYKETKDIKDYFEKKYIQEKIYLVKE